MLWRVHISDNQAKCIYDTYTLTNVATKPIILTTMIGPCIIHWSMNHGVLINNFAWSHVSLIQKQYSDATAHYNYDDRIGASTFGQRHNDFMDYQHSCSCEHDCAAHGLHSLPLLMYSYAPAIAPPTPPKIMVSPMHGTLPVLCLAGPAPSPLDGLADLI